MIPRSIAIFNAASNRRIANAVRRVEAGAQMTTAAKMDTPSFLPKGVLFAVSLEKVGGSDGTSTDPATWRYDIKIIGTTTVITPNVDPVTDGGVRRDVGICTPATEGMAYKTYDEAQGKVVWRLASCNEKFPYKVGC